MSPGWRSRRKGTEAEDTAGDDEPMAMLDLSAYDVPPERRGAFRAAVAAASDDAARERSRQAPEPPA